MKHPFYLQLYQQMREDIIAENYPYGSKLPSKRLLAEEVGVSTITIEHTYTLLCDEGYVEARQRSGYFVIFRKTDSFAVASQILQETQSSYHSIHNIHNIKTEQKFPFSVLGKTMRKVLTEHGDLLWEKSPNLGSFTLREAIRQYLARNRGIQVSIEQIVIGAGSEYLYRLIVELLGRNRIFAVESPSYKKIEEVYQAMDLSYESLPLMETGIDSKSLWKTKADVLHTTPYRSYPSGVTATASKLHEYIEWSTKNGRYIIEDDFESEFSVSTKPAETLFSLSKQDNVIYLNTFSKTISPALRIGYMVLPNCLIKQFSEKLGFYSCTVSTFMQYVLTELINNGDFERHINRVRRKKREAKNF